MEAATTATTTALNCSASEGCDAPTDVTDDASTLALSVSGPSRPQLDALPPDLRALNYAIWESLTGSYFGTSASAWGFPPTLNAETGAVSVDVAAPHLTAAGDVNVGFVTTFMPAAAIRSFWGADPATIAPGAFVATRRDGTRVVPTAASVARVDGGLRITFEGITYSTPRLTLRPKRLLRAPRTLRAKAGPRNSRRVALTAAKVKDARRYQAACSRGRRTVFARSTRRTLVVRGLAKATWTCRVRAVYQVGGRWSPTQRVRVR